MRKLIFILLFLLTSQGILLAQKIAPHWQPENIDSLKKLLFASTGTANVDLLNEICYAYYNTQMDSSLSYGLQAKKKAETINDKRGLTIALFYLSQHEHLLSHNTQAREYAIQAFNAGKESNDVKSFANACAFLGYLSPPNEGLALEEKADSLFKTINDTQGQLDVLAAKGILYSRTGQPYNALEVYNEYAKLGKQIGDVESYGNALQLIGRIYTLVGDYDNGNRYLHESIAYRVKHNQTGGGGYNEICNSYLQLQKYDSALYANRQYIAGVESIKDSTLKKRALAAAFAKSGEVYVKLQLYDSALHVLFPLLEEAGSAESNSLLMQVLQQTAEAYIGKKNFKKALLYARELLQKASKKNIKPDIKNAANLLATVFHQQNQNDSAYRYLQVFMTLKDSLSISNLQNNMAFYKTMNQKETAEAQVQLLHKDNQLKQQRLNLLLIGFFVLLLACAAIIYFINLKRKNEAHRRTLLENELQIQKLEAEKKQASLKQQAVELEMQALRAQMNPHFIFNCLNAINHFILAHETDVAADYLTRFSRLIRMVLQNVEQKTILLEDELITLRLYIELEQVRFQKKFQYAIAVDKEIDTECILIPPMLLQPFIENAIWHGLMHKEGEGQLSIEITLQNNLLLATITDNGVGRNNNATNGNMFTAKKSMGMQITANRLKLLNEEGNGQFMIIDLKDAHHKPNGTKVIVQIPITSIAYLPA